MFGAQVFQVSEFFLTPMATMSSLLKQSCVIHSFVGSAGVVKGLARK